MPRKKAIKEVKEETVEAPVKTSFTVLNTNGEFIRTYSAEIHGEKARELAEEFAGKNGGIII